VSHLPGCRHGPFRCADAHRIVGGDPYRRGVTVAYHRMFRALPTYRWYKPVFAAVMAVVFYLVFSAAVGLGISAVLTAVAGPTEADRVFGALRADPLDASEPVVMLLSLGSIATMLPAVLLATRLAGLGGPGRLSSVAGRMRWGWLARCIVPAVVFMALTLLLSSVVAPLLVGQSLGFGPVTTPPVALVWSLVIIVLLVPLQATAEEFAFRGFAMQALGSWIAWPVVAIVVPTIAFAAAHAYNPWGLADVAVFGVAAAWLTWRTGGLEAAIVAHVLNNVVLFVLLAPFAGTPSSDGSPIGLIVTLVTTPVYLWLVVRAFDASGVDRSSPDGLVGAPLPRRRGPGDAVGRAS
jgi:membrane protease YdiL (CAAX protease family)